MPTPASSGVVLDVEEFAVHDGPGIRTVVFLQGCPLRCTWCQNPEAIEYGVGHGGRSMSVGELAGELGRHAAVLAESGGGVTFSGGEPMTQAGFVIAVTRAVRPMHVAVETCGHVAPAVFARVVAEVDLVMFDVKHTDSATHQRYTGRTTALIRRNLGQLCAGSTPFVVRVPLIPGVNDDAVNLERTARLVAGAPALLRVELLPYNTMAPAKYARAGRTFRPGFDTSRKPRVNLAVFDRYNIACEVL